MPTKSLEKTKQKFELELDFAIWNNVWQMIIRSANLFTPNNKRKRARSAGLMLSTRVCRMDVRTSVCVESE